MIGGLVSANQSAFIKGRQISDNILLVHELVRGFDKRWGSSWACLKVDLSKAYDSVDRGYLWNVLRNLVFNQRWISWIQHCVGSPSFSIIVNGTPSGFIKSSRGLRQCDPLSPYLFTLIMESLTVLPDLEVLKGNISLSRMNFNVSHLIFADDVLIFCKGERRSLKTIEQSKKLLLKLFMLRQTYIQRNGGESWNLSNQISWNSPGR